MLEGVQSMDDTETFFFDRWPFSGDEAEDMAEESDYNSVAVIVQLVKNGSAAGVVGIGVEV